MESAKVMCRSCERYWPMPLAASITLYQQQTIESCPCPQCGAYTLSCRHPAGNAKKKKRPALKKSA